MRIDTKILLGVLELYFDYNKAPGCFSERVVDVAVCHCPGSFLTTMLVAAIYTLFFLISFLIRFFAMLSIFLKEGVLESKNKFVERNV